MKGSLFRQVRWSRSGESPSGKSRPVRKRMLVNDNEFPTRYFLIGIISYACTLYT